VFLEIRIYGAHPHAWRERMKDGYSIGESGVEKMVENGNLVPPRSCRQDRRILIPVCELKADLEDSSSVVFGSAR